MHLVIYFPQICASENQINLFGIYHGRIKLDYLQKVLAFGRVVASYQNIRFCFPVKCAGENSTTGNLIFALK